MCSTFINEHICVDETPVSPSYMGFVAVNGETKVVSEVVAA